MHPTRRGLIRIGWGAVAAASSTAISKAASVGDRILVNIYVFGGNDSNNMIVPLDPAQYAGYSAARGPLALPSSSLLPIQARDQTPYGLHPALEPLQNLYRSGALAFVANVGSATLPGPVDSSLRYLPEGHVSPEWAADLAGVKVPGATANVFSGFESHLRTDATLGLGVISTGQSSTDFGNLSAMLAGRISAAAEERDGNNQDHKSHRHDDQVIANFQYGTLEMADSDRLLHQFRGLAEVGVRASGVDQGVDFAPPNDRSRKYRVARFPFGGQGFARQRRLIHLDRVASQQARIRRNDVPQTEAYDIALHNFACRGIGPLRRVSLWLCMPAFSLARQWRCRPDVPPRIRQQRWKEAKRR